MFLLKRRNRTIIKNTRYWCSDCGVINTGFNWSDLLEWHRSHQNFAWSLLSLLLRQTKLRHLSVVNTYLLDEKATLFSSANACLSLFGNFIWNFNKGIYLSSFVNLLEPNNKHLWLLQPYKFWSLQWLTPTPLYFFGWDVWAVVLTLFFESIVIHF